MIKNKYNFLLKYISYALFSVMICLSCFGLVEGALAYGAGTSIESLRDSSGDSKYIIKNISDWNTFRDYVNAGKSCSGLTISLASDLDFGNKEITPITGTFSGTFDGNMHTIKNFKITDGVKYNSKKCAGLFCVVVGTSGNHASITNVITSGEIQYQSGHYVGGLVGYSNYSDIVVCGNNSDVFSYEGYRSGDESSCGGIVGYFSNGSLRECYNTGTIYGGKKTGGIAGESTSIIEYCFNKGNILTSYIYYDTGWSSLKESYLGGIVGYSATTVRYSYNIGKIGGEDELHNCAYIKVSSDTKTAFDDSSFAVRYLECSSLDINGRIESNCSYCYGIDSVPRKEFVYCYCSISGEVVAGQGLGHELEFDFTDYVSEYTKDEWKNAFEKRTFEWKLNLWYQDFDSLSGDWEVGSGKWYRQRNLQLKIDGKITRGNGKSESFENMLCYNVPKINYSKTTLSDLKNKTNILSNLNSSTSESPWAIDPNINDGYPHLKAMYWQDNFSSPSDD